jgi:hypothetical protein
MLNRRLLVAGGLTLAVTSPLVIPARAQGVRISVAFVGHEL